MTPLTVLVESGADLASFAFGHESVAQPAARLIDRGLRMTGSPSATSIVAILTNDQPSIEVLLGAVASEAKLVSLPLPARGGDLADYATFVSETCKAFGGGCVVARDDVAGLLASVGVPAVGHGAIQPGALAGAQDGGFELVQFSSGSTSSPKAVALDDEKLGTNVEAILTALDPRPGDCTVSWLPLSHDMGLVGMVLASLAAGSPRWVGQGTIVLLEPETFLRAPGSWSTAMSRWRGTFTAAPDFAYRLAARSVQAGQDFDLSTVRCAIVGGEVVRADTLRAFESAFAPHGFDSLALSPAYGLAEVGLAVTMVPPDTPWTAKSLDRTALADGHVVDAVSGSGIEIVTSGPSLAGYEIDAGPDPTLIGQLRVSGPSIGCDGHTGLPFSQGSTLLTGDVGFLAAGQLFPCGRGDDYLLVHGRNVFAPAIERIVAELPGVRRGRVGIVTSPEGDWVVVVEPASLQIDASSRRQIAREIVRAVAREAGARPNEVLFIGSGTLPMTSSGKLQRNSLQRQWLRGDLSIL